MKVVIAVVTAGMAGLASGTMAQPPGTLEGRREMRQWTAERMPDGGSAMSDSVTIVDFKEDADREWFVVNDGVMGGRSSSSIERTDVGTGVFSGRVSLENNGGFASVRTRVGGLDLSSSEGVALRVKGDGREYQLRFRTDARFDGIAYRASFETSGEGWQELALPFSDFVPSFRGRVVDGAEPLDPAAIRQLTLMIADEQEGDFRLEVAWVRAYGNSD